MAQALKTRDLAAWQAEIARRAPGVTYKASSKIVDGEVSITETTNWQLIGGVVSNPSFFTKDLSKVLARVTANLKVVGVGFEVRVVEQDVNGVDVDMTPTPFASIDTGGAWRPAKFSTTVIPRTGDNTYRVEGRLNGATSASIRFVSIALLLKP